MELMYRFEASLGQPTPVGPVSGGLRLDIPFEGMLVEGTLAGGRGWGSDYLLQRDDGVAVIDARDTFEIPGGWFHAQARGFVTAPAGAEMPSIEELTAPEFEPADVRLPINAYALGQTGVPEFQYLNRTLIKVDGWVNNATGELMLEGRAVVPAALGNASPMPIGSI